MARSAFASLLVGIPLLVAASAAGDEIADAINAGRTQYQAGRLSEAAASLEFAAQLIREQRSAALEVFLPDPLEGWEVAEGDGDEGIPSGSVAEREFHRGNDFVRVQILADSPLVEGALVMLSKPMIATADGGKLESINGSPALVKHDDLNGNGTVTMVVDRRVLVTLEGQCERKVLLAYANKIDSKAMTAFH